MQELNSQPLDYKSSALPIELIRLVITMENVGFEPTHDLTRLTD